MTNDMNTLYNAYYKAAFVKGTFEYYMLYEKEAGKEAVDQNVLDTIHSTFSYLLSGTMVDNNEQIERVEALRMIIIEKMQVLTAYTDCLQIYEYVLNRLEQKYHPEPLINEELFANKLFRYIFSVKDNMIVNENIKESIAQLPVRMTKNRYFDIIRQSIGLYKGSDKEALDAYLYMLRTAAMLYKPDGQDEYFLEYKEQLHQFETADYNALSEEEYHRLTNLLSNLAADLVEKTDFYVSVQELLNSIDTILISLTYMEKDEWDKEVECRGVLSYVYHSFTNVLIDSNIDMAEDMAEGKLTLLEGQQEKVHDIIQRVESRILNEYEKNTDKNLLNLEKMGKLMSSSIFVDLDKKETSDKVGDAEIEVATKQIVEELSKLFQQNSKFVSRAVMAATMGKMPIFFQNTEEVKSYIKNSLEQCSDCSEKNASMKILSDLMDEK